jgi:hypothetical protein
VSKAPTLAWALRIAWIALALAAGPAFGDELSGAGRAVQVVATIGLWGGWAVGLVATLVAHPLSLTVLRVLAPAGVAVAIVAALGRGDPATADVVALVATTITTLLALAPEVGEHCVNGAAYGDERRLLLRVPGMLLLGPLQLAWVLSVAGLATGPLLLAAAQWVAGAVALVAGGGLAVVALRSLHGLSRRWFVYVPAGVVLHDPMTLVDPVLFQRSTVASMGPAPADAGGLDLTQRALGLALELALSEPASLVLVQPGGGSDEAVRALRLLFTPTRPGRVLDEARRRRILRG